jgi:hypothetical protein
LNIQQNHLDSNRVLKRALPYLPWRLPRLEAGPVRLNARRLYILPARTGWVFALLLPGLPVGAINYGLSLACESILLLTYCRSIGAQFSQVKGHFKSLLRANTNTDVRHRKKPGCSIIEIFSCLLPPRPEIRKNLPDAILFFYLCDCKYKI